MTEVIVWIENVTSKSSRKYESFEQGLGVSSGV